MDKKKIIRLITGLTTFVGAIYLEKIESIYFIWLGLYITAFIIFGGDVIWRALKNIVHGKIFDENFLMSLATCGAFAIGEPTEAVGVMLFYQVGEYFQEMAVVKSKKSITDLMDIRPDYANLLRGEETIKAGPDTVRVGELILVKPGEKVPLDGIVQHGDSFLDVSALTGESVPKSVSVNDEVLSGCVNQTGLLKIKVTKIFGESTVSKILDLVENAQSKKAKTENFITSFARIYTPVVVALAVLLAVLPPLFLGALAGESSLWLEWLRRSLVFLVISCPCALVLSIPMSFFAGIGKAAKSGILVKGGNYLEAFNNLEIAVFDKTGTLTRGVFKVTQLLPAEGFSKEELLELAATAEWYSNHPIALSVMKAYKEARGKEIDKSSLSDYTEHPGYGVSVVKDGKIIIAGNEKFIKKGTGDWGLGTGENIVGTKVHVATTKQKINSRQFVQFGVDSFIYVGCIIISDEIKPDSKAAISALTVKTVILTGDNPQIADSIAKELGITEVYAGLLPHEKVEVIEKLASQKTEKGTLAFIGDGINDAPSLAMADIGIAMGALGSDAAIEAADVVLMTDEPSKLPQVINIARFTKKIVWQNIVFALGIKSAFLVLGAFGIAGMWEAVFADVGVALLAVLNAMRIVAGNR